MNPPKQEDVLGSGHTLMNAVVGRNYRVSLLV